MGKKILHIALILVVLLVLGFVFYQVDNNFNSPQEVRDYVEGFGALGPLVVIGLITLEVVLAPIPGYFIAIGSGAAFGPYLGTLYSYIGNLIGTMIAFLLSRHYGRPLAKKLIKEKKLKYYDKFFKDKGIYGLWLAYIFPIFPVDIISFVTGLSNIKFSQFFRIIAIGFIPNMLLLNYFGDRLITMGISFTTIFIAFVLGVALLMVFINYKKKTI